MKVFPIESINFNVKEGAQTEQFPAVQANIDANAGLAPVVLGSAPRIGPVAIVGFGPSLRRTWEQLRDYSVIWTTSGAHDFLLKRGIVPTYHTDVDWRPHKAGFLKRAHSDVQYRMANTVHPKYIEKLRGYKLTMFQPIGEHTSWWLSLGDYPEVKMPGDVGMAAIEMAVLDGWTDIHTFGMDGSHDFDGAMLAPEQTYRASSHAGMHDGAKSLLGYVIDLKYNLYQTSQNLLTACDAFCKMMDRLPDNVSVTVISDGLLPAWIEMYEQKRDQNGKA